MIDAVDLVFTKVLVQGAGQLAGGGGVAAEGLLNEQPAPAAAVVDGHVRRAELVGDMFVELRGNGEIVKAPASFGAFLLAQPVLQVLQAARRRRVTGRIEEPL